MLCRKVIGIMTWIILLSGCAKAVKYSRAEYPQIKRVGVLNSVGANFYQAEIQMNPLAGVALAGAVIHK
jgi:hypothetical protein